MAKRDIGKEIIQGLEEIKAWKKGRIPLKEAPSPRRRADAPRDLPIQK